VLLIFATKKGNKLGVLVKFLPSSLKNKVNDVDKIFWKRKSHTIDGIEEDRRQITFTSFCLDFLEFASSPSRTNILTYKS